MVVGSGKTAVEDCRQNVLVSETRNVLFSGLETEGLPDESSAPVVFLS